MRSLLFRLLNPNREEELITDLWERGTSGIIEQPGGIRAFFDDDQDLTVTKQSWQNELVEECDEPATAIYSPSAEDWDGICVGQRFFFAPPWVTAEPPDGRMRIPLDSGAAFGTGRHETTQMMIERLETVVRGGETVLDVGCGSGVLSEVCRQLGARAVFACDIDPLAVGTAVSNFNIAAFIGSADAIAPERADILLVNISAKVIDALATELKRTAKPNAVVLLAGFVAQSPPVCFTPQHAIERNEWLCWTGSRDSFLPDGPAASRLIHSKQWW